MEKDSKAPGCTNNSPERRTLLNKTMLSRMQNTVISKMIKYAVGKNTFKDFRSNTGERYGAIITDITSDALLMHRNNISSMPFG